MFRVVDEKGRDITMECLDKLHKGVYAAQIAREELAKQREEQAAAMRGRYNPHFRAVMSVDPVTYWHWVAREGAECWGDKGFRKDLLRDNPQLGVKTEKREGYVSMAGLEVPLARNVRETKRYGGGN